MTVAIPLYKLADALQEVAEALVENGGELTPELEAKLGGLEGKFERKVEQVLLYARNVEAAAAAAAAEAERLSKLATSRSNASKRLEEYAKLQMERAGVTKVETDLVKASVVRNSVPSIKWTREPEQIPEAFRRVSVTLSATAARDYLKQTGKLPDGFEVTQGTHLRVR